MGRPRVWRLARTRFLVHGRRPFHCVLTWWRGGGGALWGPSSEGADPIDDSSALEDPSPPRPRLLHPRLGLEFQHVDLREANIQPITEGGLIAFHFQSVPVASRLGADKGTHVRPPQ